MYLRITDDGTPRETLVSQLRLTRAGRGEDPLFAGPAAGYYYVEITHQGVLDQYMGALHRLGVAHEELETLPEGIRLVPKKKDAPRRSRSLLDDPRVREAAVDWFVDLFKPGNRSLFDRLKD